MREFDENHQVGILDGQIKKKSADHHTQKKIYRVNE